MVSRRSVAVLLGPSDSIDGTLSGGIVGLRGGADTTQPMMSDRSASKLGRDASGVLLCANRRTPQLV